MYRVTDAIVRGGGGTPSFFFLSFSVAFFFFTFWVKNSHELPEVILVWMVVCFPSCFYLCEYREHLFVVYVLFQ